MCYSHADRASYRPSTEHHHARLIYKEINKPRNIDTVSIKQPATWNVTCCVASVRGDSQDVYGHKSRVGASLLSHG